MPALGKEYTTKGNDGPLTFPIDGEQYEAVPLLPADQFGPFMRCANQIARTVPTINSKDASIDDKAKAIEELIRLSLTGLEIVLLPESNKKLTDRVSSRERPLDVPFIAQLFADLAGYYNGVTDEEPEDEAEAIPTDGDNGSPTGSETTGTPESEAPSSANSDETASTDSAPGT